MKNQSKTLKEENKSHLKIIELLLASHDSDFPLRNYRDNNPSQICITNQDCSNSSDSSTWNLSRPVSRPRPTDPGPSISTPANSQNRFAPLSIELENTCKNNQFDNQSNCDRGTNNYKKIQPNHIHQCSNANAKNAQIFVSQEKCYKNFTPTTVPGNSTYSGIIKHGRKNMRGCRQSY